MRSPWPTAAIREAGPALAYARPSSWFQYAKCEKNVSRRSDALPHMLLLKGQACLPARMLGGSFVCARGKLRVNVCLSSSVNVRVGTCFVLRALLCSPVHARRWLDSARLRPRRGQQRPHGSDEEVAMNARMKRFVAAHLRVLSRLHSHRLDVGGCLLVFYAPWWAVVCARAWRVVFSQGPAGLRSPRVGETRSPRDLRPRSVRACARAGPRSMGLAAALPSPLEPSCFVLRFSCFTEAHHM